MAEKTTTVQFHVCVHAEDDGSFWSEIEELPGCFASGFSLEEVQEATFDAMQLWLPDGIRLGLPKWSEEPVAKPRSRTHSTKPRGQRMLVQA
jgi:predicted RNase H-like HicB family nuclease